MKVVINHCYGGFSLSNDAIMMYLQLTHNCVPEDISCEVKSYISRFYIKGEEFEFWDREIERDDAVLVQVVETLGGKASGTHANLRVVEVPDGVEWHVEEYDGMEHIAENHRTWY